MSQLLVDYPQQHCNLQTGHSNNGAELSVPDRGKQELLRLQVNQQKTIFAKPQNCPFIMVASGKRRACRWYAGHDFLQQREFFSRRKSIHMFEVALINTRGSPLVFQTMPHAVVRYRSDIHDEFPIHNQVIELPQCITPGYSQIQVILAHPDGFAPIRCKRGCCVQDAPIHRQVKRHALRKPQLSRWRRTNTAPNRRHSSVGSPSCDPRGHILARRTKP